MGAISDLWDAGGAKAPAEYDEWGEALSDAVDANTDHAADTANPHEVTAAQAGALATGASAGGDLAGTYPNPTVAAARGIRETDGPTVLTVGAVADGQVLTRSGSTIVGAAAGGGQSFPPGGLVSGRYYDNRITGGSTPPQSGTANVLRAVPWYCAQAVTIDRIVIHVTSAGPASSAARLGIYEITDGDPGALVLDAGTVAIDSTGTKEITISQALTVGWYGLAFVHNAAPAPSFRATPASGTGSGAVLLDGGPGDSTKNCQWGVAHSYGALPSPAPAMSGAIIDQFLIGVRVA